LIRLTSFKDGLASVPCFENHRQFEITDLKSPTGRLPRLDTRIPRSSRADRFDAVYLRAAQAYMLISMPTGTSTILGAFQVIPFSHEIWRELRAKSEPRTAPDIAQVRKIESRTLADRT
jgi:hypothetical protein